MHRSWPFSIISVPYVYHKVLGHTLLFSRYNFNTTFRDFRGVLGVLQNFNCSNSIVGLKLTPYEELKIWQTNKHANLTLLKRVRQCNSISGLMQSCKTNYFRKLLHALRISPVNCLIFKKQSTIKAQIDKKESKKDWESCCIQLRTAMHVF